MAKDTSPACKQCRREGLKLYLKGERCLTDRCAIDRRSYAPGEHGRRRIKQTEYLTQLREKQKARRYYGLLGKTVPQLLRAGQSPDRHHRREPAQAARNRLDNVVYRLGFAVSRRQSRQLVMHGHFMVNGRRVDIPSYRVKPDDMVAVMANSSARDLIKEATDLTASVSPWLQADHDNLSGKILKYPEREEIDVPVQEQLIVELYSK